MTLANTKNIAQGFTEVSTSVGIDDAFGEVPFGYGGGISFYDFDNDGWDDLTFSTQPGEKILFYKNNGGQFSLLPSLVHSTSHHKGLLWTDIDNDGDADFCVSSLDNIDQLFENTGNLNLQNISVPAGIHQNIDETFNSNAGDIDRDGYLDLFFTIRKTGGKSFLYHNNGDNTFTEISSSANLDVLTTKGDQASAFFDFNKDGYPDIYSGVDKANGNHLFQNNGDLTFSDVSVASNTNSRLATMNVSYGDIDNDGDLDFYLTDSALRDGNVLYKNNGDGTFTDISLSSGANFKSLCWSANFADFNNDGYLDIYVVSSYNGVVDHNRILINNQDLTFTELSDATLQNLQSTSYISAIGDYNKDGRLDIAVGNGNHEPFMLFQNNLLAGNYITMTLEGTQSNRDGIGTWIELHEGGLTQYRYTHAGISFSAQDSKTIHYGIGSSVNVDSVVIRWPSGIINTHYNLKRNNHFHFVEGPGPIDFDLDGVVDANDCDDQNNLIYPGAPELCDCIDNNCDSIIDENCPGVNGSIARQWNEVLLTAIRNDLARPTVHARNLFHISTAMYDAWAVYDQVARPYFLGNSIRGFDFNFSGLPGLPADIEAARHEAISYAAYRLLKHRFQNSPGSLTSLSIIDNKFNSLGYDSAKTSTNYQSGDPSALGNYIASKVIQFGLQDGSREQFNYNNSHYQASNDPLVTNFPGNPDMIYPNHWQPLTLETFIDQSGNEIPDNTPPFLSPEWGEVIPFSLNSSHLTTKPSNGFNYKVYRDPGAPPQLDTTGTDPSENYKWGFSLVSIWSSHLDPSDGVMWDISPANIGNIQDYPTAFKEYPDFYDQLAGGDASIGHNLNPHTGLAYRPNLVPRADYARVLAEFWADGPDSETPPGHWFSILNYVSDHPLFVKRYRGQGAILDDLEWDVKSYFTMGGAVHDAAISAWGIKGYYDYVRPISAIRYMADQGQSTNPAFNYSAKGLQITPGYIETVSKTDPLVGANKEHFGKIKVKAWKGPDYINDPASDIAGVDWILAENWWPYQRPSFVTPNFAGYISGHSTFSRAAAEVMTLLTGDAFFPGGMGEFIAPANDFLVFEEGPSVDVKLQWATYRDASDQTSLSRIWGGIHPPADDIPGRLIGEEIGIEAFHLAEHYFLGLTPECVNEYVLPSVNETDYNAIDFIQSDALISTGIGQIEFTAGNYIGLETGFEVKQNIIFDAWIEDCLSLSGAQPRGE